MSAIISDKEDIQHEEDDKETEDTNEHDSFISHFNYEVPENFASEFSKMGKKETELNWTLGDLVVNHPAIKPDDDALSLTKKTKLSDFHLKENLMRSCETSEVFKHPEKLSPLQSEIFSVISSYKDFYYIGQSHMNCEDIRSVYCLHILNHVLRSRARITHHDSKLAKNPDEEYRDQGYTRPTVLILAPFKASCLKIVNLFSSLLQNCDVLNKKRFLKEFGSEQKPPSKRPKPADHEATFEGNTDDDFKIGLRIKNRSIKLYTSFYASDVIIASPVCLRAVVGAEGDKNRDFDFLSSIEIFVLDQADVLLMQNWLHVTHIAGLLNLQPKEPHGCQFFRIRYYALNGLSKSYRQTLVFSAIENPYHRGLFSVHCCNHEGYVRTSPVVQVPAVCRVLAKVPQVFHRFESDDFMSNHDKRYEFFISKILPDFKKYKIPHTLIFISSYYEYVRLRNYFRRNELSATMICEYSDPGKVAEGRNLFFNGDRQFMLYTERYHFYNRKRIKGVENVVFYQLPSYPTFYSEICNFLLDSDPRRRLAENSCTVVFSQFDWQQLKPTVGFERCCHMLNSSRDVYMLEQK